MTSDDPRVRVAAAIISDHAALARHLVEACPAPTGHAWHIPSLDALPGWRGDLVARTRTGVPFILAPSDGPEYDLRPTHVEVRWFRPNDGLDATDPRHRHQALLWCQRGARRLGFVNLLDAHEVFHQAETIDGLVARIAGPLLRILAS